MHFRWKVKQVCGESFRLEMFRRRRESAEEGQNVSPCSLPIGCSLDEQPDAVHRITDGRAELLLERGRVVGRIRPLRQGHDAYGEPVAHRELHPA